ncbi:shikimate dehydrogenase [Candidatus Gottesmanbacteria bacterium]|nr:shikimate dehydrogenase [Candidatus Gottesmanbacteria bacterium]
MIDAHTKLCCVIGHPVTQSLSPTMHNAAYEKLGLNYAFLAFDITNVFGFINAMRILNIRGTSVTIPYKLEVMKYLDKIDAVAKEIGAVNTIVNDDGKLTGYNTDWIGAVKALEEKTNLKGKRIAILGTGGAARAIAYGLKKKDAYVFAFDRFKLSQFDKLTQSQQFDIILNATPIGMSPDDQNSPITNKRITNNHIVFDIIFAPHQTKLLRDAQKKGAAIVYGYKMLLYQAAEQFKLFTGQDASLEVMEKSIEEVVRL